MKNTYYYNRKTRQSSWTLPEDAINVKENFEMNRHKEHTKSHTENMYEQVFHNKQDSENHASNETAFQGKPKLNLIKKKAKKIMTTQITSPANRIADRCKRGSMGDPHVSRS